MGYLPNITGPEMAESPSGQHYRTLMGLSASARGRGDHQEAQQFATAAHQWAMDEHVRLQRLVQAREALVLAERLLQSTWDKDRDCETLDELRERHPEFKRVIVNWEGARDVVHDLSQPDAADGLDAL